MYAMPTSGGSQSNHSAGRSGVIAAVSWDATEGLSSNNRLKLSFVLGHNDSSHNTGFTMFDFDNDGMMEICYRDEKTLRIIKASEPFIKDGDNNAKLILFTQPAKSYTGFEYPTIADIDNDASAEIITLAHEETSNTDNRGYVYAVGNKGDKFAPARPIWNQFMYDPFKINDDLTVPAHGGKAPNRLDKKYQVTQIVKDENGKPDPTKKPITFNPYNGTLIQMPRFELQKQEVDGVEYDKVLEPIVFFTDVYFRDENDADISKRPKITFSGNQAYIEAYVGNKRPVRTDVATSTPISIYRNEIGKSNFVKKIPLSDCFYASNNSKVNAPIKVGDEVLIKIPIANGFDSYIFRIGDDTDFSQNPTKWKFGESYDSDINDQARMIGYSAKRDRDCDWTNQTARASLFMAVDDPVTLQEYTSTTINILANDVLPAAGSATFKDIRIVTQPESGVANLIKAGGNSRIEYTHNNAKPLTNGVDKITYEVTYTFPEGIGDKAQQASVYIFILKSATGGFVVCYNEQFTAELKRPTSDTEFYWYATDGITEVGTNPQTSITIPNMTATKKYKIRPKFSTTVPLYALEFPLGELTINVIGDNSSQTTELQWTGTVSNDWFNPNNWKDKNGVIAKFAPTSCVEIIVPKVTTHYPMLDRAAKSASISIKDRAMIANTHYLDYAGVSYEFALKQSELNRWLMLSAPIRKVYTGDYMLRTSNKDIMEEAAYMSLFQTNSPDGTNATPKSTFTRPFANVETELTLGVGLMLYGDENVTNDLNLFFPATANKYIYNMSNLLGMAKRTKDSGTLSRQDGIANINFGAFITESAYTPGTKPSDGAFNINYSGGDYILVVNPFPSFLNVSKFLDANTAVLERGYKIWKGTIADDFVSLVKSDNGMVWKIKEGATLDNASADLYVPPFQAFFVKTKSGSSNVSITYQPETMTDVSATRDFLY